MDYNPPVGGSPGDPYINGNPTTGTEGSIPPAAAVEFPQREIVAAIVAAGLTPDNGDLTQLAAAIKAMTLGGEAQSWVSMTGLRSAGVTYFNTTGRPISVSVLVTCPTGAFANFVVGGVSVSGITGNSNSLTVGDGGSVIVPDGASYVLNTTGGATLNTWTELR